MSSENNYRAISIDTNSLKNRGFALKGPILSKFQKFKGSEVFFIQSDVIHRECLKHFALQIEEVTSEARNSLSRLNGHGVLDEQLHKQIKTLIEKDSDFNQVASERLHEFYELTGAEIINASDYLDVSELFDLYFQEKSPFEPTGKKKCEFPDACALLSLEGWAESHNVNLVLISSDKGWEDYATSSSRMLVFKDVAQALDFLLPTEDKQRIYEFIDDNGCFSTPEFIEEAKARIESFVENLEVYVHADSPLNWYTESENLVLEDFEFKNGSQGEEVFSIINIDQNKVDISIPIILTCYVEAEFALFVRDTIDHEDISMGSISESRSVSFDAEIFVSIQLHVSDGYSDLSSVEITDVESYDYNSNIDFGYIDPFYDANDY